MSLEYSINYHAENYYNQVVDNAVWQFLIIPEENDNQKVISADFSNSLHIPFQESVNGYGFRTWRVNPRIPFSEIRFSASFKLLKNEVNPFDFQPAQDHETAYTLFNDPGFMAEHEPFLRITPFSRLPPSAEGLFQFSKDIAIFDNLRALNHWVNDFLQFRAGVTDVNTTLEEVIKSRQGVCQDFTHLFCAFARKFRVPVRYVSGYLHQGSGYYGDSQMHAWAEAYIPEAGWTGFDPTNDILAGDTHIKVAHGKDYQDCSPIKGVIFNAGENRTTHTVTVSAQQTQQ